MTDDTLLKKVGEMIVANNEVLITAIETRIDKKIQASEQRLEKTLTNEVTKLNQQIKDSQIDTIEALSELVHTGYNMHEERIQRVEKTLHLPPLKQ